MESVFSVYRRREKENFDFEKLHILSLGAFNKTVEWLRTHPDREKIIDKVGFHIDDQWKLYNIVYIERVLKTMIRISQN